MDTEIMLEEIRKRFDLSWEEDERLEFKSAKGGIPAELWPSYSAFANTAGGYILLGVENDGTVSGVKEPAKVIDNLFITLNNPQKCSAPLCDNTDIQIVTLSGKQVVAMYVPKAEPAARPVFIRGNETYSYLRRGSADVRCKPEDLLRMRRNRAIAESLDFSLDSKILSHSTIQDLNASTLRKFRLRMQVTNLGMSLQDLEDIPLLKKLGAYRVDRATGEEGITLAGLLMFGTDDALAEFCPYFQLDYFEYDDSTDVRSRWIDRITTDGTWPGNLFEFFYRVLPRLLQSLKLPFRLNDDLSRNESSPAHIAVREALANALIHADYYENFGIRIDQRPSGITFTNPGSMLVDGEHIISDQQLPSICRNKGLQKMFQTLGVVDKAGSGIDKIIKGWMDCCIALPVVRELQQPDRVSWQLPSASMISRERIAEVVTAVGEQAYAALDAIDKLILLCIPAENGVGHGDMVDILSIHPADLSKRLAHLVSIGLLKNAGRGRGTKYCLADAKSATSDAKSATSDAKSATSDAKSATSDAKSATSEEARRPLPPSVLLVQQKKKTTKEEMRSAILELCAVQWMSIQSMALTLDRNVSTIRPHCEVLVAERKLRLRYLDNSNHPDQAYRSTSALINSTPQD